MIYFSLALLFFLGLHVLVARYSAHGYGIDLACSRSMAAFLLVVLGFSALWLWWPLWRQAFLIVEPEGASSGRFVAVLAAHLVADHLWLMYGRFRGETVRTDLVLHHLLGMIGCAAAWYLGVGYTLIAVVLTTEMLPVAAGFLAWARANDDAAGQRLAQALGLTVLVGWRLPCWAFLAVMVSDLWRVGNGGVPRYIYPIALVAVVILIAMDLLWARGYLRLLRRPLGRAEVPELAALSTSGDGETGSGPGS